MQQIHRRTENVFFFSISISLLVFTFGLWDDFAAAFLTTSMIHHVLHPPHPPSSTLCLHEGENILPSPKTRINDGWLAGDENAALELKSDLVLNVDWLNSSRPIPANHTAFVFLCAVFRRGGGQAGLSQTDECRERQYRTNSAALLSRKEAKYELNAKREGTDGSYLMTPSRAEDHWDRTGRRDGDRERGSREGGEIKAEKENDGGREGGEMEAEREENGGCRGGREGGERQRQGGGQRGNSWVQHFSPPEGETWCCWFLAAASFHFAVNESGTSKS